MERVVTRPRSDVTTIQSISGLLLASIEVVTRSRSDVTTIEAPIEDEVAEAL